MLIGIVEDDVHYLELLKIKLNAYKQEGEDRKSTRLNSSHRT